MKIYADITKMDEEKRLVYGYASTETLDAQGERVSKAAIEGALDEYMRFANIREMHQLSAVGVAQEATLDDKGLYVIGKVVDDAAWRKVKEGVYKGFSIGGKKLAKVDDTVTQLKLTEISLVDRPANPETVFTMYKSADPPEMQKGMGSVSMLSNILDALNDLRNSTEWESEAEGDNSAVPAKLKDAVDGLSAILQEMVAEETAELTFDGETPGGDVAVAMAEKTGDIAKAGARNSKDDMAKIQTIHDHAMALGADCKGAAKAVVSENLLKISTPSGDDLQKALDAQEAELKKVSGENADLRKRVAELEAQPAPAKGALKDVAVNKTEDTGEDIKKVEDEPTDPADVIKKIHRSGGVSFTKFISGR